MLRSLLAAGATVTVLAVAGCGGAVASSPTAAPPSATASPTSSPTASPTSYPSSSLPVVYQNPLSQPTTDLESGADTSGGTTYGYFSFANGGYEIDVNPSGDEAFSGLHPDRTLGDTSIDVDVHRLQGTQHESFGVFCRATTDGGFYKFTIAGDGHYAISEAKDGSAPEVFLAQGSSPSPVIRQGNATNHIRADCIGSTLTLYVNGQQLLTAQNSDLTVGGVDLEADCTTPTTATEVVFSNLVVRGKSGLTVG